ncbi:DHH family phosphoesterase [Candidatus Micrarchaeota archaeon]|nr:DHH family phosphoesterase [Candidatus Micrarchaeota archaeon]
MIGAIRRIKYFGRNREYTLTDGRMDFVFQSNESYPQGSFVSFELSGAVPIEIKLLAGEEAKQAYAKIRESVKVKSGPNILRDEVTEKLWPMLERAAAEIATAKKIGKPVMLRFHGDADGICSAFAISSVIYCKSFQQNSAVYSVKDALRDIGNFGQEAPLVLLLDFGSNDQSLPALELLRAAGIDYMIIDHHPHGKNKDIINPFLITEKGSRYTAGYLACEIAVAAGMDLEEAGQLAKIACAGDKSDILGSGEDERKKAMVLDFLAAHISFGNNIEFYRKVMKNQELFDSILIQARESIDEAAAKLRIKEVDGPVRIIHFSLENVISRGEWPPSSKITTKIFEERNGPEPLVVLGYNERSIIIRLNEAAEKKGFSANGIAEKLKQTMPDFIEGGGGHIRAGAIRARKGFVKEVLGEIIRMSQ